MVSENYAWTSRFKRSGSDKKCHSAGFCLLWSKTWARTSISQTESATSQGKAATNDVRNLRRQNSSHGGGTRMVFAPSAIPVEGRNLAKMLLWPLWMWRFQRQNEKTKLCGHYGFAQSFLFSFNDLNLPTGQCPSTLAMTAIWKEESFTQNIS